MVDELDALRLAIEREKGAHQFYSDATAKVANKASKEMFNWLANEELGHIKVLEKARAAVQEKKKWLCEEEYSASGEITKPIDRAEFPKPTEAKGEITKDIPEMEILSRAIADEKDAISFYADVAEGVSDPDGKKMLKSLSAIEKGHLELLEEEYEWIRRSKETFTIHRFTISASG
jgi:rubrerythrin